MVFGIKADYLRLARRKMMFFNKVLLALIVFKFCLDNLYRLVGTRSAFITMHFIL